MALGSSHLLKCAQDHKRVISVLTLIHIFTYSVSVIVYRICKLFQVCVGNARNMFVNVCKRL